MSSPHPAHTRVRRRALAALAGAAACLALSVYVLVDFTTLQPRLRLDPGMEALLPTAVRQSEVHRRASERFGDDDVLLVVWQAPDLFTPKHLAALRRFAARAAAIKGVAQVDNLGALSDVRVTADTTVIRGFLDDMPDTDEEAAALRARALLNPLVAGLFVSHDGQALTTSVRFDPGLDTEALSASVAAVKAASAEAAPQVPQFLTGPLKLRLELGRILLHDLLRITPLAMLTTLLVAAFAFRSSYGVWIPVAVNGVTTLACLAVMSAGGQPLNFVTASVPPVVYVIGFAYAVHVISTFDRYFRAGLAAPEASAAAVRELAVPLTLTALTTAVAFAALGISAIESIRVFGSHVALGALLAWAGAMSLVPAALSCLGYCRVIRQADFFAAAGERLAGACIRWRRGILALGIAGLVACGIAGSQLEVDTAVLRNFSPEHPVRQDFLRLQTALGGSVPLRIVLESDQPDGFRSPRALQSVAELERWLTGQHGVAAVYSLADYVGELFRALAPDLAAETSLPTKPRLLAHTLLLADPTTLHRFADPTLTSTVIRLQTSALSTAEVNTLAKRIQQKLDSGLAPGIRGTMTGLTVLSAASVDELTHGQLRSLLLALLAVLILLSLVFGSLRVGAIAIVPNALPIVAYYGLLAMLPLSLNLTNSLVACAVFGIAIDDTVHFISRYAQNLRDHERDAAIVKSLQGVIRPVTLTTAALVAGFASLGFAELRSQAEFGLLAAATLAVAWLVDLVFTPALFSTISPRFIWRRR